MKLFNFSKKDATSETFNVKGMTCGHCTSKVEKFIGELDGVKSVTANLADGEVTVVGKINRADVISVIERLGYSVES